ncbi:PEP-CTERM sorting domain-containing protein [Stieleria sp. TO1_6]|uniref:PEP-CTERM sorting domain-containing protein n=1 Tax=Stieleria tagensis TaxID=2956795 RepID=UPI00209B47EB|nr:PEP-CTERM sorting domain-containing protein [Stieleria tagensis]MCO8121172.1 PEP-CTERM sorting domain-containing protein [Stieleria tagensis]
MRKQILTACAAAVMLIVATSPAEAGVISGLGNPSSAIPGGTLVDFESAAGVYDANFGPALSSNGVTFNPGGGTLAVHDLFAGGFNTTGNSLGNFFGLTKTIEFSFDNLVDAFAFNVGATFEQWTLTAYSATNDVLGMADVPQTGLSNSGNYIGFAADGIARATLSFSDTFNPDFIRIDNLVYSESDSSAGDPSDGAVPEPTSLAIFGLGAIAMTLRPRRRRRV